MPTASKTSLLFAAAFGLAAGDAMRPPADQLGARLALEAIDAYRAVVSPAIDRTGLIHCKFHPTCSAYGREAIRRYGLAKGGALAAARVARCSPFSKGGEDPVP